mmetsp:Transcript_16243/g.17595  ORF Transcript_16243/g.17595 Transcript_16243/m.17595 type:complete len:253 (-) Transcript_16243:868-1626(-)
MGGSASTGRGGGGTNAPSMNDMIAKKTEIEVIRAVLPIYYTKGDPTPEEKQILASTWKTLINGQGADYLKFRSENPHERRSPGEHFGSHFYSRYFEVNTTARPLFTKPTSKQAMLLANMITFIIREVEIGTEDGKITKTLTVVANSHNRMGIRAHEYGTFGEVLFWAIRLSLGPQVYTTQVHRAWIKFYSKILAVVLPLVVKYEIEHKGEIKQSEERRMTAVQPPSDALITHKENDTIGASTSGVREAARVD